MCISLFAQYAKKVMKQLRFGDEMMKISDGDVVLRC